MTELDPRFTFENFVVGPANRLAFAAARRAAESPGTAYNPLFLYASSGLGKSHLLGAVAHQANRLRPESNIVYLTLENFLTELAEALEAGEREQMRDRYEDLDVLLLDDVQFLAGQTEAQEMLLRTFDTMSGSEKQVVLASDRPPADIDGLDARLVSRFSGGLIVDLGPPEFETRVAILRKKAEEREAVLQPGVAEAMARIQVRNVRELGGALNRVLAVQDLEGKAVTAADVARILDLEEDAEKGDDFGSFVDEVSVSLADTVDTQEAAWRRTLRSTAEEAEALGFSASRLRRILASNQEPENLETVVSEYRAAIGRLEEIQTELRRLGNPWPDTAKGVLKDPERLEEAESLLTSAEEKTRPFPPIPEGPGLEEVAAGYPPLAGKAAEQLTFGAKPEYNPLFVWSPEGGAARRLGEAAARSFRAAHDGAPVGFISVAEFAEDFIRALSTGVAGAWRERWWSVDLLVVHGVEALSDTERAQDEFFHLFEALQRRGARILLGADRPPAGIEKIDERLRSRFEGGLVVEVEDEQAGTAGAAPASSAGASTPAKTDTATEPSTEEAGGPVVPPLDEIQLSDERGGLFYDAPAEKQSAAAPDTGSAGGAGDDGGTGDWTAGFETGAELGETERAAPEEVGASGAGESPAGAETKSSAEQVWRPSGEVVVWRWPVLEDRLVEDAD